MKVYYILSDCFSEEWKRIAYYLIFVLLEIESSLCIIWKRLVKLKILFTTITVVRWNTLEDLKETILADLVDGSIQFDEQPLSKVWSNFCRHRKDNAFK